MHFPVCSGKAPWSGGLMLMCVFSNKWGYRWVSLLRHRGRSCSKVTNAVCSWSQVNLCPRFPGQTGPLALLSGQSALPTRFSAQALLWYAASRCSRHPSLSGGAGATLCSGWGSLSPAWGGLRRPIQAAPKSSWTGFLVSRGREPQSAAVAPWLSSSSAWAWADWTPGPAARPLGSPSQANLRPVAFSGQTAPPTDRTLSMNGLLAETAVWALQTEHRSNNTNQLHGS